MSNCFLILQRQMFAPLALQRRCFHVLFCIDLTSVSPGSSSRHGPEEQRAHEDSSYCRHNDSPVGHWRFRLLQVESWIPESAVSQCGKKGFLRVRTLEFWSVIGKVVVSLLFTNRFHHIIPESHSHLSIAFFTEMKAVCSKETQIWLAILEISVDSLNFL